jgi:hypothetical protein
MLATSKCEDCPKAAAILNTITSAQATRVLIELVMLSPVSKNLIRQSLVLRKDE